MTLEEWVDICGLDGIEKLSHHEGGRKVYIPVGDKRPAVLSEYLSAETVAQITSRFAGDRVTIPLHRSVINWASMRLRKKQVKTLIYDGLSNKAIARITNLSATTIATIRKSMDG